MAHYKSVNGSRSLEKSFFTKHMEASFDVSKGYYKMMEDFTFAYAKCSEQSRNTNAGRN